jgi:NTE family protein
MNEIKNLIISGGGFNGFQFFGIIKYLEENNLISKIDKFIGASMGAFINFMIISNYTYAEIEKFILEFDFSKIFDIKIEKIFLEDNIKGLSNGENFNKLIKKFIINKNFNENITLKEFYEKTKKEFIVSVSNITYDRVEYISHVDHPDLPVYKLLRMTSCIPLFFEPIEYNSSFYLDGALKDNFPIQLIPDEDIKNTLGIVMSTFEDKYNIPDMGTIQFLTHICRLVANGPVIIKINKYKCLCSIIILKGIVNSFDYNINSNVRFELIENGYNCCKKILTAKEIITSNEVTK